MKMKTADVGAGWPWVSKWDLSSISFCRPLCFTIYRSQSPLAGIPAAILSNPSLLASATLLPHSMLCIRPSARGYKLQRTDSNRYNMVCNHLFFLLQDKNMLRHKSLLYRTIFRPVLSKYKTMQHLRGTAAPLSLRLTEVTNGAEAAALFTSSPTKVQAKHGRSILSNFLK